MKKVGARLLMAVLIGGTVLLAVRFFFPSDAARIAKVLGRLERASNVSSGESTLVKLGRIHRLEELFAPDCQVAVDTYDYGKLGFSGRKEMLQAVSAMAGLQQKLTVKFPQTGIKVGESGTNAVVEVAATIGTSQRRGETLLLLKLFLDKMEGTWRIRRVESIRSLRM